MKNQYPIIIKPDPFTEAALARKVIEDSEEKYRVLFYNSPLPIWIYELNNYRILDVNEAAIKYYGYNHVEFINMTMIDVGPKEAMPKFLSSHQGIHKHEGIVCLGVCVHQKKNKELILVEVSGQPFNYRDKNCMMVICNDVTEREHALQKLKDNEARLKEAIAQQSLFVSIVNSSEDAIISKTLDGTITSWNRGAETIFGYAENEAVGKNISIIIPSNLTNEESNIVARIKRGEYVEHYETERVKKDGSLINISLGVSPVLDSNGKVVGASKIARDITERKKSEKDLKELSEQLRNLSSHLQNTREEERKRIAREIHDDLGQQLTVIKMDVVWIDKKIPEEITILKGKLKNVINLLDESNQSVRRILSELRSGFLEDHGLLEAIEWLGREFTANTGIPVNFSTAETEIKSSESIATCIFRIHQEAFTNITRYAGANKVSTSLSIIDDAINVSIEDDGIGFDAGLVQHKTSFGILGMKGRVLSLEGKFELITSIGKGTKIFISLPYNT